MALVIKIYLNFQNENERIKDAIDQHFEKLEKSNKKILPRLIELDDSRPRFALSANSGETTVTDSPTSHPSVPKHDYENPYEHDTYIQPRDFQEHIESPEISKRERKHSEMQEELYDRLKTVSFKASN